MSQTVDTFQLSKFLTINWYNLFLHIFNVASFQFIFFLSYTECMESSVFLIPKKDALIVILKLFCFKIHSHYIQYICLIIKK